MALESCSFLYDVSNHLPPVSYTHLLAHLKGYTRAFIVTGGVIPQLGLLDKLENILKGTGMEVFSFTEVENDPSIETVMRGKELMLEFQPDLIVAIGGGSAIDAAKAMWVFYEHPDLTFQSILETGEIPKMRNNCLLYTSRCV